MTERLAGANEEMMSGEQGEFVLGKRLLWVDINLRNGCLWKIMKMYSASVDLKQAHGD